MTVTLAVPVFNRYDLLRRLFESLGRSSVQPDRVIVIDNGDRYVAAGWPDVPFAQAAEIIRPGRNIGVAAAWNLALDACGPNEILVVSNDDIELGVDTLRQMFEAHEYDHAHALPLAALLGRDWSLWMCAAAAFRSEIGYFDENFFPAYFEDNDIARRIALAGRPTLHLPTVGAAHVGSATLQHLEGKPLEQHHERFRKNRDYYIQKWGGEPGKEQYTVPFDGRPPPGWRLRPIADPEPRFRYDAINQALRHLKKTEPQRYLEIGVSDGDCLRRVKADRKVGVDPDGQAAALADEFHAVTSDAYFDEQRRADTPDHFDVIFIDGLHTAEQVLKDITNAWQCLQPDGLILLHDCSPRDEAMQRVPRQQLEWTGDVWRTMVLFAKLSETPELQFEACVLDTDYGVGVIAPNGPFPAFRVLQLMAAQQAGIELAGGCTYQHFDAHRKDLLHLIHPGDFGGWLRKVRP